MVSWKFVSVLTKFWESTLWCVLASPGKFATNIKYNFKWFNSANYQQFLANPVYLVFTFPNTEAVQPTPVSSSESVEHNDDGSYGLNISSSSDEIPFIATKPSLFQNTASKNTRSTSSSGNRLHTLVNGLSASISRRHSRYFTNKNQTQVSIPLTEIGNGGIPKHQRDDDQAELIHQEYGIEIVWDFLCIFLKKIFLRLFLKYTHFFL